MARPDLVGIVVRDMAAALAFYRLLGLDIPTQADSQPHFEITTPGGFRIAWDTIDLMESIHDEWSEPTGHRVVLAFECDSPAEVDALYGCVIQAGYQGYKSPWDAFWGQRYAVIIDPDGNLVDLFAGLP
jgi:catechol 2,3-dioxygenase-like lactoylglutathione lyase family enzyme